MRGAATHLEVRGEVKDAQGGAAKGPRAESARGPAAAPRIPGGREVSSCPREGTAPRTARRSTRPLRAGGPARVVPHRPVRMRVHEDGVPRASPPPRAPGRGGRRRTAGRRRAGQTRRGRHRRGAWERLAAPRATPPFASERTRSRPSAERRTGTRTRRSARPPGRGARRPPRRAPPRGPRRTRPRAASHGGAGGARGRGGRGSPAPTIRAGTKRRGEGRSSMPRTQSVSDAWPSGTKFVRQNGRELSVRLPEDEEPGERGFGRAECERDPCEPRPVETGRQRGGERDPEPDASDERRRVREHDRRSGREREQADAARGRLTEGPESPPPRGPARGPRPSRTASRGLSIRTASG